jgi:high potential iron-sulfur protein
VFVALPACRRPAPISTGESSKIVRKLFAAGAFSGDKAFRRDDDADRQEKANEDGMETRKFNWSRRTAVRAAIGAVAAALSLQTSSAQADEKMTRQQAQYQDTPNGIYSCGNCSLFERPKSCKVVAGDVSEDGWCKAFALVD